MDGFVDGVDPVFGFVGAGHYACVKCFVGYVEYLDFVFLFKGWGIVCYGCIDMDVLWTGFDPRGVDSDVVGLSRLHVPGYVVL